MKREHNPETLAYKYVHERPASYGDVAGWLYHLNRVDANFVLTSREGGVTIMFSDGSNVDVDLEHPQSTV